MSGNAAKATTVTGQSGGQGSQQVDGGSAPQRPALVLTTLIVVAGVANVNLAVANVALPSVGRALDASQTGINLVAVGFSLGLAASVLYFGALGDRYGRKQMVLAGLALTIPAGLLAALAPTVEVLVAGRILGGVAAGMAFPTTLALVAALWSGRAETKAVALWSGIGGALSLLGPLGSGALLEVFWWGSVFLLSVPLAVVGLVMAVLFIPSHVHESRDRVDHPGGLLSMVFVAALVLAISFAPMPGMGLVVAAMAAVAGTSLVAFILRQRRAANPLYDLSVAGRRTFWVAAVAGMIVFGSLMGGLFIGQQFLQNVLGFSTLAAGAAVLPQALGMVVAAPVSARMVERYGSRLTLLLGFAITFVGFALMLLLWGEGSGLAEVLVAYAVVGTGVGIAATPASRVLVASVPVARSGMASATADLQRDLGGAVMQAVLGAILTASYAKSFGGLITGAPAATQQEITDSIRTQLMRSFSSAENVATTYPNYASEVTEAARTAFVDGANWAYAAALVAIGGGVVLVAVLFPRRSREVQLLQSYAAADPDGGTTTGRP